MHVTYRSYLTAGVAALGAGAIALTPVQPIPNHLALAQDKAVATLAVNLASTIDPITPWVDTFKLAGQNIMSLVNFYLEKPFPLLQTIGANIGTYIQELPDFQKIFGQIAGNINTFFYAPWSPGACATDPCGDPAFYQGDFVSNVPITNKIPFLAPDGLSQRQLYALLPAVLPAEEAATLAPLLALAGNHWSGQLAGLVGPLAAPLIVLTRSFTAIGQYFADGDVIGAINELINIPANVTNGVLNGAGYLDLTGVVNAIVPLPDAIKSIGLNLGGLISPPVPFEGTLAAPTALNGGTLFDNIAVEAEALGVTVKSPGLPVSWFGSVIGLGQFLSEAMLVPAPTAPTAAVRAAATETAPVVAEVAAPVVAEVAAPAVADTPAEPPAKVLADDPAEDPAPPVVDDPVVDTPDVKTPARKAVSAPAGERKATASNDDDKGAGSARGGHRGARGKHAA
ncbi:MAG: hypothetical protein H6523_19575 [Mycolicibacterium sp.]|nr:hypothetical protein [Mycolicibacterium sp.]